MTSPADRPVRLILAENIRSKRSEAELTQSALAALLGVESLAVSRWERGAAMPRLKHVAALAELFFGGDVSALYRDAGTGEERAA